MNYKKLFKAMFSGNSMNKEKIELFYDKNYKKLMLIPIIIFLIATGYLFFRYASTGNFVEKDVSLSGGITATVTTDKDVDINDMESVISSKTGGNVNIRRLAEFGTGKQIGLIIETSKIGDASLSEQSNKQKEEIANYLGIELTDENYSSEEVGSTLGQSFFKQLLIAVITAFVFMSIVVFITFRSIAPSIAVIAAALMDMIISLAVTSAYGVSLTSAGIAAFLLVIGYSVDTDILLTTKVLKRKGEGKLFDRMWDSMKTGMTMTVTTLVALTIGLIVSNSYIIRQMFAIILIALIADILTTYLTNTAILKIYCQKKGIS